MQPTRINGTFKESLPWSDIYETQGHNGLMLWRISLDKSGTQRLEVSESLLAMISRTSLESPKNWWDFKTCFVHPADWEEIEATLQGCRNRPQVVFHFEHRLLHAASGQWRWVKGTAQGKKVNSRGLATKIFGGTLDVHDYHTDLNDLHQTQHDLRQEKRRLAAIINASDIVIWDWNLDESQRVYGEVRGSSRGNGGEGGSRAALGVWDQLLSKEDRERAKEEAERHARGETPFFEMEYQVTRPNGGPLWLLDRGRRVDHNGSGRSRRLMGVMTDITSQKNVVERLREHSERLELVTRATGTGTWDWNIPDNKITFNEAYTLMMGYGPGELDGDLDKWRAHIYPEDMNRLYNRFINDSVDREMIYEFTVRMRHKEGHYIKTYNLGRVVDRAEGGRARRIVGVQFEPHRGLAI